MRDHRLAKGVPPAARSTRTSATTNDDRHREVNGRVEVHQNKADVIVVQSGTATLQTGGEVIDPVTTADEIQLCNQGGVNARSGRAT